jgi:micrococcal nuclease
MVRRLKRRRSLAAWIVPCIPLALVAARVSQDFNRPIPVESLNRDVYRVRRVVDGDTLVLTNDSRIRLIGVDTPELNSRSEATVRLARAATEYARQFVRGGEVRLEFDRERLDHYGRFLAYVYVGDQMLNEELIRQGHGRAMLYFNYAERFKRRFRHAENEAKQAKAGIWAASLPGAPALATDH